MARFTLNGALRYDNSQSKFGKTCVGPDSVCRGSAVSTIRRWSRRQRRGLPRHHAAVGRGLDVFGNGKTALKWSMGKYLGGTGINGIYTAPNVARTVP